MTASLNERYNALILDRATASASPLDLESLTEGAHGNPMLENAYLGHFLSQPIFVDSAQRAALERDLVGILDLLRSLPERLFDGDLGRMCDAVGMTPLQRRVVLETAPDDEVFLSRADLYQAESGFKLLEYNIISALGGFENAELNRAMMAAPLLDGFVREEGLSFPDTAGLIAEHVLRVARRHGLPSRPRLVIVEWPHNWKENEILRIRGWADLLSARGFDATICHAGQLSSDGDGGLYLEGRPVDVFYRYFPIEDLLIAELAPLIEPILAAHRRGKLLLAMGFSGELVGNKRNLAFLSDDANRSHFSPTELDLIDRLVPWTRILRPGPVRWRGEERDLIDLALDRQQDFVLKPSLMHGSIGFVAGWAATPERWRSELEKGLEEPYVIQERIVPLRVPLAGAGPDGVRLRPTLLNWGIFIIDDHIGGAIIRGVLEEPAVGVTMSTGAMAGCAFWRQ